MSRVERSQARDERQVRQAEAARAQAAQKKRRKKKKGGILWLLVLILAILVGAGGWYTMGLRAVEPGNTDEVVVEIPEGSGASSVVYILNDAGLVKNLFCARVNAKIGGYKNIQQNTYIFNRSMTFPEMMKAISEGDFEYISKESMEVKDGARLQQVAESLSEHIPLTTEEILAKWADTAYLQELIDKYWFLTDAILDTDIMYPLEGYLYADTYMLTSNTSVEEFTGMCLDRMDEELSARKDQIDASGFTVHEFLTLASIVNKEAMAEDQAKVAGVFINRLNSDISLGSDVTVCYIYQEDRVELKQSQLDNDSPYNTRKFAGLPPGPICQMTSDVMDAVINYEKTDYLFFFADEDGTVHYYKNNEEFEQGIDDEGLLKDEDTAEASAEESTSEETAEEETAAEE